MRLHGRLWLHYSKFIYLTKIGNKLPIICNSQKYEIHFQLVKPWSLVKIIYSNWFNLKMPILSKSSLVFVVLVNRWYSCNTVITCCSRASLLKISSILILNLLNINGWKTLIFLKAWFSFWRIMSDSWWTRAKLATRSRPNVSPLQITPSANILNCWKMLFKNQCEIFYCG